MEVFANRPRSTPVRLYSHITGFILSAALLLQATLPLLPTGSGGALAQYMCAPQTEAVSEAATAHLKAFLQLAGKPVQQDKPQSHEHCESCVIGGWDIALPIQQSSALSFRARLNIGVDGFELSIAHPVRGPPVGERAPPVLI